MTLIINPDDTFKTRKQERTKYYESHVKGWRRETCLACNGSGFYDHDGNPDCDGCSGRGYDYHKTNLEYLYPLIGTVLQYNSDHDEKLPERTAIRIYIRNTRTVMYQYVDLDGVMRTSRKRAKLKYLYNTNTKTMGWAFSDTLNINNGSIFFLQEFEPDKQ